ncbi:MAG TPA: 1,2-phenylacetyl-CoA epoxidase subunit PaaC [Anaerolineae bacterium]|jgi:ring-1,2-phenylacetyl-CoA epoxidase subunit PaaC|nr:1,2-phenylacetyl-CoA epoxidase subunit PaaC [Anaerolineae bacterium]
MSVDLDPAVRRPLADRLLAMADDELILAHRNSEWTGHAPILEEDIAFANIAQDELGHASLWYALLAALTGEDPDQLAFFREANAFRCAQLVQLPRGDWAFSMLRQYLFDAYEMILLADLSVSRYRPLAEAAAKIRPEEIYHHRHTSTWIRRLGRGTEESCRRVQRALDILWPMTAQLFWMPDEYGILAAAGIMPDLGQVAARWFESVRPFLVDAHLTLPADFDATDAPPRGQHSPHLAPLLAEMQEVARLDEAAQW